MEEKYKKYADVLLKYCLSIKKGDVLFISSPIEVYSFLRILSEKASLAGVKEIYFDLDDEYIKRDLLKNINIKTLKINSLFNKEVWSKYAKKNSKFLILNTTSKGVMDNIKKSKLNTMNDFTIESKNYFIKKQMNDKVVWTNAPVPTNSWKSLVMPSKSMEEFWDLLLEICKINDNSFKESFKSLEQRVKLLNKLKFKELHFKNNLGTDLVITLPKTHRWKCSKDKINNEVNISNFPSYEVFTAPIKNKVDGVVYSTKPLLYNGHIIKDFCLEFVKGKVVKFSSKEGEEYLKEIIKSSNMLGEVALVDKSSIISKKNITFYNTLLDENASCHLALGSAYNGCVKNNIKQLNHAKVHVDFMIGTEDLLVKGITYDGKEYDIIKNGEFSL